MSKRIHTLPDVETNLGSVAQEMPKIKGSSISVVDLIEANHSLRWWVFAHGSSFMIEMVREPDIKFVEAFWSLCAEYGIILNQAEKQKIYQNFLDD